MNKTDLRHQMQESIKRLSAAQRDTASLYACLQVLGTAEWQQAQCVLLYEALPDEVNLQLLIDDAHGAGKEVIMPSQRADAPAIPDEVLAQVNLALIPGRAFAQQSVTTPDGKTKRCWMRMGRGGGWYDRMLGKMAAPKWGMAFGCQIVKQIPTDEWDVALDRVIEG